MRQDHPIDGLMTNDHNVVREPVQKKRLLYSLRDSGLHCLVTFAIGINIVVLIRSPFFEYVRQFFFYIFISHSFANPRVDFIKFLKRNNPAIILHFTNSFGRIYGSDSSAGKNVGNLPFLKKSSQSF
jgi:hypothetical protein